MDALSEVLRLAKFGASVTLDATAHAPWCVAMPASAGRAHLVLEGECVVMASGADTLRVRKGELALLPRGNPHLVASDPDADAKPLSSLARTPVAGEQPPVVLGGGGATTRWLPIAFSCERHLADTLLSELPAACVVDLRGAPQVEWLAGALGLTLSSSDAPEVATAATRARLAELVLLEALRRHVQATPAGGKGWIAGLNDRYVGRALALVHGRPSEPWTVERLGRQVGLSRSALAERFSEVMGEPIFAFLTRWRLQLAADFLLTTPRSITSIAREAGYESTSAFSHAFKRVFGSPPTRWRRKSRRK